LVAPRFVSAIAPDGNIKAAILGRISQQQQPSATVFQSLRGRL
jgi:hypothetical protein